ncbi:MAG: hypothetical protein JWN44_4651 [Myxococcales bacterium]|nr:hypothetical protein [Myxococcales bacterium]
MDRRLALPVVLLVAAAVGAATVAGCKVDATGVIVTVEGVGLQPDQLRIVASVDGSALPAQSVPATASALTLPVSFFAELGSHTGSVSFDVTALAAGTVVGHGSSPPVAVAVHQQPAVTVSLTPSASGDGGVASCGASAQPAACAGGSYVFCDGFENETGAAFTAWTAAAVANAGGGPGNAGTAVTVQAGAPVCAGSRSLHAVASGSSQQAFVYKSGLAYPATTYLRAFVYLPSATSTNASYDLFSFGTADASQYLQIGYDAPAGKLFAFRNFAPQIDFPTTLPLDRWLCVEATLRLDATAGSLAIAIDGAPLGMQTGTATQPAGATYSVFQAGLVFATMSTELYLDEIVLSATAVGCH